MQGQRFSKILEKKITEKPRKSEFMEEERKKHRKTKMLMAESCVNFEIRNLNFEQVIFGL